MIIEAHLAYEKAYETDKKVLIEHILHMKQLLHHAFPCFYWAS